MAGSKQYSPILITIFEKHFRPGMDSFVFERAELTSTAEKLKIELPKNLGDLIYAFRFRTSLPAEISKTAPKDMEWRIELAGRARYRFALGQADRIVPRSDMLAIKIPDATPEVVAKHALGDEQALLAKLRYNRLIDLFLGVAAYSLQSHLRTTVEGVGQIEVDEIYVAVDKNGVQYVIPVQAKGGGDQLGAVQAIQDMKCCAQKFPDLIPRPVAAQFAEGEVIALFELALDDKNEMKVVTEKHYRLVPADEVTKKDLQTYRALA